jgi:hypothetical protein
MDNFSELLKYIVPLVIFILSAAFGGKNDKRKKTGQAHKQSLKSSIDRVIDDLLDQPNEPSRPAATQPAYHAEPKPKQKKPKPSKKSASVKLPNEGERAIVTDTNQKAAAYAELFADIENKAENETQHETIEFDARKAVIYSTILDRKY